MRLPLLLAGVVQLLLASPLAGQDARLAARLEPGTRRAVQAIVDSATAAGIPADPLIRKALEGESKGADSVRIVTAVRRLSGHLGAARRALGPTAGEADLVAAAAALNAGASPGSLTTLKDLLQADRMAVPLSVLADLLAGGVAPDRAWNSVRDMAAQRAPDADYLALRDRLVGSPPQGPSLPPPAERPPGAGIPSADRPGS